MVDAFSELSDLSHQLNDASRTINFTIESINNKLRSLNLGIEAWLDSPLVKPLPGDPSHDAIGPYLGFCDVEERWQLAVRGSATGTYVTGWSGDLPRTPLTKASREVRIAAIEQVPALFERLKAEAHRVLLAVQSARQFSSQKMAMNRDEIRAMVLTTLAESFERGNRRANTFDATTPEEAQPLMEILAELRSDGSISERANTYNFTPAGYAKHRDTILALRSMRGGENMIDYRVDPDGTAVVLLSERATQRGTGPKPQQGWRLAFKTRHDTADFVQRSEAEGFTFDGKEFLLAR
ncbi:MAG TPA: hypothetical protein VMF66_08800 [Candidatus Acidoferrum sp.]|nr:hypothetical protein [Candidatus Acidoferrum sp.]